MHESESKRYLAASGVLTIAGLLLLTRMMGNGAGSAYRFAWVLLFGMMTAGTAGFLHNQQQMSGRARICMIILSSLYLFLQMAGYQIHLNGGTTVTSLLVCLGAALCMSPAGAYLLSLAVSARGAEGASEKKKSAARWMLTALILLVSWLPVFLAYYPGLFTYDSRYQIDQYLAGQITAWHPPLHTLWLGVFYSMGEVLGSYNLAFALHILSQMVLMAMIFAHAWVYLYGCGVHRALCSLLLVFFALFPVHALMGISCTKDTIFTGVFLLLAVEMHRLYHEPKKPGWRTVKLLALCVLCCLLRNNMIYGLVLVYPFAVIAAGKKAYVKTAVLLLCCVAASFISYQTVQNMLGEDWIENREKLSVPSQQLARVARDQPHNPYQQEILSYIPHPELYDPYLADHIKGQIRPETPQDVSQFMSLWGKVALTYPLEYLDAFLLETQGLWWMDDLSHSQINGRGLSMRTGYLYTSTYEGYRIEHVSRFPLLEKGYEYLFSANAYQNIPVLSMLFSPALYLWTAVVLALRAVLRRQKGVLVCAMLLLCYVCTLLLGPCILVRYVYPLMTLVPVLLCLSFGHRENDI